jgi:hypothetical protein
VRLRYLGALLVTSLLVLLVMAVGRVKLRVVSDGATDTASEGMVTRLVNLPILCLGPISIRALCDDRCCNLLFVNYADLDVVEMRVP